MRPLGGAPGICQLIALELLLMVRCLRLWSAYMKFLFRGNVPCAIFTERRVCYDVAVLLAVFALQEFIRLFII